MMFDAEEHGRWIRRVVELVFDDEELGRWIRRVV
jgi:hypothetical protein